ncbi:hypothetical protein EV368DRAFT_77177 [Lentinula lateritia]|nr:hypothetical protein EV368DRAFT_77177 [Lentinula lateritia]
MEMYDENNGNIVIETVRADVTCTNCDTPSARKLSGHAGHSHDLHCCPWCHCTLLDVNRPAGYYSEEFILRDDYNMLKQKLYAKDALVPRQSAILKNHGVHFSAFDWIPGWRPSKQTALDFMHCMFLGVVAFLWTWILFAAHMFPGANGSKHRFEDIINSVRWPTHITRLPKNLGEYQSLKKADEWRRLLTVTPIILWYAWRDNDDSIPDTEPPRLSLYNTVLYLCVAVRLLSTKRISMVQANQELTINHHLAMHFAMMVKLFGPVYAWWLFAFERFNGILEKVKTNGHDGGRCKLTMLRN